jgi:hypothetical protein
MAIPGVKLTHGAWCNFDQGREWWQGADIIETAFLLGKRAFHKVAWDSLQERQRSISLAAWTQQVRRVPYGSGLFF